MTDHLLEEQHLRRSQPLDEQGATQETKEVVQEREPPRTKYGIVICYDESDDPLLALLEPYLQLLYRRLGSQIERHYFCYQTIAEPKPYTGSNDYLRKSYEEEKAQYERMRKDYESRHACMLRFLERYKVLFVACISNTFMTRLWADMQEHHHLASLFSHEDVQIAKVLIRPTSGETTAGEPLCAYEGVALERACQQVTAMLETMALSHFGQALELPSVTPFTLLSQPSTREVSIPSRESELLARVLGPLQTIVEQAHTRIVESQHKALTEQRESSQAHAELRSQIEQMRQELARKPTGILASIFPWLKS